MYIVAHGFVLKSFQVKSFQLLFKTDIFDKSVASEHTNGT